MKRQRAGLIDAGIEKKNSPCPLIAVDPLHAGWPAMGGCGRLRMQAGTLFLNISELHYQNPRR